MYVLLDPSLVFFDELFIIHLLTIGCRFVAGGPLIGFIMMLLFPLLWGAPIAFVTAELSTAYPDDGAFLHGPPDRWRSSTVPQCFAHASLVYVCLTM